MGKIFVIKPIFDLVFQGLKGKSLAFVANYEKPELYLAGKW
jgi:hypothetical protein